MATVVATNTAELEAAFAAAADGDRIELAGGNYDAVSLQDRDFPTGLTLASADPNDRAVLVESLLIQNCSGITLEGIDLVAESLAPNFSWSRLQVRDSADITLRDMLVQGHVPDATEGTDPNAPEATRDIPLTGFGYEYGLLLRDSSNVVVEDVEITDFRVGLRLNGVVDTTVTGLDLHHTREGINLNEASNLVVENSIFRHLVAWRDPNGIRGDHPDMIQFWGVNSSTGLNGITFRDNFFFQPDGDRSQSIFGHLRKAPAGVTGSDFTITGNTIINGATNAIKLSDISNIVIADNILLPNSEALTYSEYPRIALLNVDGAVVTGNTLLPRWNGDVLNLTTAERAAQNVTISNNTLVSDDPTAPDYWKYLYDAILPTLPFDPNDSGGGGTPGGIGSGTGLNVVLIDGTSANDNLTDRNYSHYSDNVFQGFDGDDKITDTGGNDTLEGGLGADQFIFDSRKSGGEDSYDVILDLNFPEGDSMRLLTGQPGTFSDDVNPFNNMIVSSDGSSVIIRSKADLIELHAGASVNIVANATDTGVVLQVQDEVLKFIELEGILMTDLGLA